MKKIVISLAAAMLLTSCEIEDELEIRPDGSGTYHARITVERIVRPVLEQLRGEAERQGFRIVEEGLTLTTRYIVIRKDFADVRALSGPRSNFDLQIEQKQLRRQYHLRATIGAIPNAPFERRFTIKMPATVTSASAGGFEGRQVTWYCANGGTIDVTAEAFHVPLRPTHYVFASGIVSAIAVAAGVVVFLMHRRRTVREDTTPSAECTTCFNPIPSPARYCPACGDRVLPPASHRASGSP